MHRRCEYEKLLNEMYTVYIESSLASPLMGSATLEISPRDTIRKLVSDFLFSLEKDDGVPGLALCDKQYNKLDWDATVESQGIKEGSKLFLVYDKASLFRPVHLTFIGLLAIAIAVIGFITVSVLFSTTGGEIPFDYGIVIDAGSTHTEVFLYQWSGSKFHGTGEVNQRSFCHVDVGIAEGSDPDDLVSCVNNVTKALPMDITSPVILYLGATAGMRLLNVSNPLDAHLILTAIKYALKTTSVQEGSIEIIQGQDEGLFSWVTTNFLTKTLLQDKDNATYGALDLGGASTQVAFALNPDISTNLSDVEVLKLYGHEYSVMAKSFLCFGLSQASNRNRAIMFMNEMSATINDPCLSKNYTITLPAEKFAAKPCIQNDKFTKWIQKNTDVKELKVIGNGNYEECVQAVQKVTDETICKSMGFEQCLNVVDIAEKNRKFMAFSSFYYIVNYISPNSSLEEFISATRKFCSLSYDQLKERAHSKDELSHLLTYCFGAVYVEKLLIVNYGFNNHTWKNILFQQSIKGADVGWSLGFMINATNAIPEELPKPPVIALSAFIPLVIISVLIILFAVILLKRNYKFCHRKENESLLESIA